MVHLFLIMVNVDSLCLGLVFIYNSLFIVYYLFTGNPLHMP